VCVCVCLGGAAKVQPRIALASGASPFFTLACVEPLCVQVSYTAIRKFLEAADIRPFLATVVVEEVSYASGIVAKLFALCFGPPKLDGPLASQRERLFAIAKMPFDDAEPMHLRMLQSVFRRFTGVTGSVQRYGSHWEDVGFQVRSGWVLKEIETEGGLGERRSDSPRGRELISTKVGVDKRLEKHGCKGGFTTPKTQSWGLMNAVVCLSVVLSISNPMNVVWRCEPPPLQPCFESNVEFT